MVIYFAYGIRHSGEDATPQQDKNENEFIMQETPNFEQDLKTIQPSYTSEDKVPLAGSFGESAEADAATN